MRGGSITRTIPSGADPMGLRPPSTENQWVKETLGLTSTREGVVWYPVGLDVVLHRHVELFMNAHTGDLLSLLRWLTAGRRP